jgi:ATP-dependent DNA helicase DinG
MHPTIQDAFGILREQRTEQLRFAELVDTCIVEKKNATIEAGTGTGKSFGYLIPVVSQGRKAIVSTGTIALQEQLIRSDLPFLQKAMREKFGITFTFAMLKGASNYLCNRRFSEVTGGLFAAGLVPDEIAEWGSTTKTGDLGEAPDMSLSIKEQLRVDVDDCGKKKCPHWEDCHHQAAKERAKGADVLVVVHAMTTMGLGEPYGLSFGDYDVLVVDEAHQFEDYARSSFEGKLSPARLSRFFQSVEKHLVSAHDRSHWDGIRDAFRFAWRDVIAPWMPLRHSGGRPFDDEKLLVDVGYLREASAPAIEALTALASYVSNRVLESDPEHAKIARQMDGVREFFQALAAGDAIAVAERRVADGASFAQVTMVTFPLFIGARLAKDLYPALPVIFTSATISAGGDFSMLKQGLGIDADAPEAEIGSPFDYPRQSLLYIPRDGRFDGKFENKAHAPAARQEIETLLQLSQGGAFVLFTSNKAMRDAYQARRHGYPSKWQEPDSNKNALIQWFKATPGAVLYATASFWEGVSIEGEALRLVIIEKVPFPPKNDPIIKAKEARHPEKKGFATIRVPIAIIKLKQGFGRLIRTQTDRGMVAILDSRIVGGISYGRRILAALPDAKLITDLADRDLIKEYLSGPLPTPDAPAPAAIDVPAAVVESDAHLAAVLDAAEAILPDAPLADRTATALAAITAPAPGMPTRDEQITAGLITPPARPVSTPMPGRVFQCGTALRADGSREHVGPGWTDPSAAITTPTTAPADDFDWAAFAEWDAAS